MFQAGTARNAKGDVVTAGGRVACVTALGDGVAEARARAYEAYEKIGYDGKFCRHDIGARKKKETSTFPAAESTDEPRPSHEGRARRTGQTPR